MTVLLLELEGVIADTRAARRAALDEAMREAGLLPDDAVLAAGETRGPAAAAQAVLAVAPELDGTDLALLGARIERAFSRQLGAGVSLAPGAAAFLDAARGRARIAIVTRGRREDAMHVLTLAGVLDAVECIVGSDDVLDAKPSPEGHVAALARLARRGAIARERCVALEDSLPGIRAARAAGLRCVAVGVAAHEAMDADAWIASLAGHTPADLARLAAAGAGAGR